MHANTLLHKWGARELGERVRGWGAASGGLKREESVCLNPHWQVFLFPEVRILSSLEIDLAYRCVLFGRHKGLKNFELVANF